MYEVTETMAKEIKSFYCMNHHRGVAAAQGVINELKWRGFSARNLRAIRCSNGICVNLYRQFQIVEGKLMYRTVTGTKWPAGYSTSRKQSWVGLA